MDKARGPCWKDKSVRARTGDECFYRESNAAVLADQRGVVLATNLYKRGVGLGNQLFGTAGLVAWALRLGRLPAVGCSTCFVSTMFSRLSCVEPTQLTKEQGDRLARQWDGGFLPPLDEQRKIRAYPRETPIDFSLWFQASLSFQDYAPAVCVAMQPTAEVQERAQRYWARTLAAQPLSSDPALRRTVALHVRRGDYAKGDHPRRYGILSEAYYVSAVRLVQARAALVEPDAADHIVAVVFTTQESVSWCAGSLAPLLSRAGVRDVVCANTSAFFADPAGAASGDSWPNTAASRCKGEEADLLAMALADFVVVANSTFSWWVHFFHKCRTLIPDWWGAGGGGRRGAGDREQRNATVPTGRGAPPALAYVFPPVWMNEELSKLFNARSRGAFQTDKAGGGRSMLFNFLTTDYLVTDVRLQDLFVPVK